MSLPGPSPRAREELFDEHYLRLRRLSLRRPSKWASDGDGIALLLVEKGEGEAVCGRMRTHFGAGDILVFKTGPQEVRLLPASAEIVVGTFSLRLEHLAPLFTPEEVSLLPRVAEQMGRFRRHPALGPLARECFLALGGLPEGGSLNHRSQLLHVATLVIGEAFREARQGRNTMSRLDQSMRARLEALSNEELTGLSLHALAGRFGCTPRHLNRLFQRHFGLSVGALRMETRLLKAASLLRDPDAKVSNVAKACGFGHLGLFNTCFKRRFGVCPSEWRQGGWPAPGKAMARSVSGVPRAD